MVQMTRVYFVTSISSHERVKRAIVLRSRLQEMLGSSFCFTLPQDLHENKVIRNESIALREMEKIMKKCLEEIRRSDALIALGAFGMSTAWELGYFFRCKEFDPKKKMILFKIDEQGTAYREHMIMPNFDVITDSVEELSRTLQMM